MVNFLSKPIVGAILLVAQFAAANPLDANHLQDLEARKIKIKTDTAKVPGQTPPPVITVTKTVTKKSGQVATETIIIIDPSSNSDAENIRRAEKAPSRHEFQDAHAKREGDVLCKPMN
ncbi:MAG: hypothetical protein LQ340_002842 [Diploschistes diacapsis]|nr:MAG: hypothetical protein LQ340_002842 [Diploschistes diacapsis]